MAGVIKGDRLLADEMRRRTLKHASVLFDKKEKGILNDEENDLYKQAFLKLIGTALPRINDIAGEDGEPIKIEITVDKTIEKIYGTGTG